MALSFFLNVDYDPGAGLLDHLYISGADDVLVPSGYRRCFAAATRMALEDVLAHGHVRKSQCASKYPPFKV